MCCWSNACSPKPERRCRAAARRWPTSRRASAHRPASTRRSPARPACTPIHRSRAGRIRRSRCTSSTTMWSTPSPTSPARPRSVRHPSSRRPMSDALRFPAEWESQSAVLVAWPHAGTDWADRLADVERTYVSLVSAIARFQPVVVCVADAALRARAESLLAGAGVRPDRVRFVEVPYDDTWLRDSGPITLRDGDGFRLLDFRFTAWGGKFEAGEDDQLVARLHAAGLFGDADRERIDFALEGGGIET